MMVHILKLLVLAGLVLVDTQFGNAQVPNTEPQPNILFVSVDDLNDWVGFMNGCLLYTSDAADE